MTHSEFATWCSLISNILSRIPVKCTYRLSSFVIATLCIYPRDPYSCPRFASAFSRIAARLCSLALQNQ